MITTRRSSDIISSAYNNRGNSGGVGLLERPKSYKEFTSQPVYEDDIAAAQERRRNLDKLLNYDRYSEQMTQESAVVTDRVAVESDIVSEPVALSDEDIRPTSTTMQFGEDVDQIREEMCRRDEVSDETSFRLNSKGKLVVVLYSLVVTVILALIVLNTGVLASLSGVKSSKSAELTKAMAQYEMLQAQIDSVSSAEHVINVAQNEYGMIKSN